jgi:nucleotide-binding universal stress UspA family protein
MAAPSRILVAIDGSEHSLRAADYAFALARSSGSAKQVFVITVLDLSSIFKLIPKETKKQMISLGKMEAGRMFDVIGEAAKKAGISIKTDVIESSASAADAIINYATKNDVDLIVVGSKGRTGASKVLLGSVASKVVTYAACPVIVVK